MFWPLSLVVPPQIVFQVQSAPVFAFEVLIQIILAVLLWAGLLRLRQTDHVRVAERNTSGPLYSFSLTDSDHTTATDIVPEADKDAGGAELKKLFHVVPSEATDVHATPPIKVTPPTPPLHPVAPTVRAIHHSTLHTSDDDATDYEDAEESSRSSNFSTAGSPRQFMPIARLEPPATNLAVLASMPPIDKTHCNSGWALANSANPWSRSSSPIPSPGCSSDHTFSDSDDSSLSDPLLKLDFTPRNSVPTITVWTPGMEIHAAKSDPQVSHEPMPSRWRSMSTLLRTLPTLTSRNTASWLPPASYPVAGPFTMMDQEALRNQCMKRLLFRNSFACPKRARDKRTCLTPSSEDDDELDE